MWLEKEVKQMNGVEHFRTKKGLLESLGKKGDDTRCYDRMYTRGEVWHDEEGYYVINPALEIEELKKTLDEKEKKISKLEDMIALYDKVHNQNAEEYNKLLEEYEEYKRNTASNITMWEVTDFESKSSSDWDVSDLEYLNNEYIKLEENREQALRKCYEFMASKKIFDKEKNPFEDFFYWASWCELK